MSDLFKYLAINASACGLGWLVGGPVGCGVGVIAVNSSGCGTEAISQNSDMSQEKPDMSPQPNPSQSSIIAQYEKECKPSLDTYCSPETQKPFPNIPISKATVPISTRTYMIQIIGLIRLILVEHTLLT